MSNAKSILKVGDKVGYSKKFLRSIFACQTDSLWFARGEIVELKAIAKCNGTVIAKVRWVAGEIENYSEKVNVANLARIGSSAFCE